MRASAALSDDARLMSDVCLSVAYIGPKSRTERSRKTKIGIEVAHVTRDSDTHFQGQKVKGQGHQAALLSAALTHKVAAAVSVRKYWTVGKLCYVASARRHARRWGAHGGGGEGRRHFVRSRPQLVLFFRSCGRLSWLNRQLSSAR